MLLTRQNKSTLKGGEGWGSGKGLNSRYGGNWKQEKVFLNESVSTILQLLVVSSGLTETAGMFDSAYQTSPSLNELIPKGKIFGKLIPTS